MLHSTTRGVESKETGRVTLELTHVIMLPHMHLMFPIYIYVFFGLPLESSFYMSSTTCFREILGSFPRTCVVYYVVFLSICGSYIISLA